MKKNKSKLNTSYLFILPYALMFLTFVVILIAISMLLSLMFVPCFPQFIALSRQLFTQDIEHAICLADYD